VSEGDLKTFIREITRRNEVIWNNALAELEQGRLVLVGLQNEVADVRADLQAHTKAVLSMIDDHRDETRAQTKAMLRLLDRRSRGED
jgi:hypothetical protein